ncbi:unnamed protein product, partial [Symbiodinium natans]
MPSPQSDLITQEMEELKMLLKMGDERMTFLKVWCVEETESSPIVTCQMCREGREMFDLEGFRCRVFIAFGLSVLCSSFARCDAGAATAGKGLPLTAAQMQALTEGLPLLSDIAGQGERAPIAAAEDFLVTKTVLPMAEPVAHVEWLLLRNP